MGDFFFLFHSPSRSHSRTQRLSIVGILCELCALLMYGSHVLYWFPNIYNSLRTRWAGKWSAHMVNGESLKKMFKLVMHFLPLMQ